VIKELSTPSRASFLAGHSEIEDHYCPAPQLPHEPYQQLVAWFTSPHHTLFSTTFHDRGEDDQREIKEEEQTHD
jgi:hypothetical protein